jgi:adenylate cyclase
MSFIDPTVLDQIRSRITKTLTSGIQLNMSTQESKKLLKRHVNSKTNLVIMFVDINNSTQMSLSLPENTFALIVQTFAQEISIAVQGYGGYVFKYEGDAVIVLFPAEYDPTKASEITIRIGLAYGYGLVVLYGNSLERSYIDIVGSSISLASKIASIAQPNQVLVGESIHNILLSSVDNEDFLRTIKFKEMNLDPTRWKYLSHSDPKSMYHVYELLSNQA